MLHAPLCHGLYLCLVFVYPIVTVFSSQVLDTNTDSCVASNALYTLTLGAPTWFLGTLFGFGSLVPVSFPLSGPLTRVHPFRAF